MSNPKKTLTVGELEALLAKVKNKSLKVELQVDAPENSERHDTYSDELEAVYDFSECGKPGVITLRATDRWSI